MIESTFVSCLLSVCAHCLASIQFPGVQTKQIIFGAGMVNSVQPRNQMNSAVDQIGHLHLFEVIWTVTAPSNEFTINADNRVNIQCDTYKRLCHYSSDFLVCLNNEFSKQVPHNIFTRFERGLNLNTGWCLDSFSRKPGKNVTARNGFFIFNTRIFRKSFEI